MKYGWLRTEKVEDIIVDYLKLKEDQYEDNDELILAMKELRQGRIELERTFDEFDTLWMLEKMRKRRKIENFELQSQRNVVKEGGPNIVSNFEKKFKEIKIEGKRMSHTSWMYTERLPATHYIEAEQKEIEAL